MAIQAVLQDGWVGVEKWASLGRVAVRTALVDGICGDQALGHRTMRVVATRTRHSSGFTKSSHGHVGVTVELHGPYFVTLPAQVPLNLRQGLAPGVVQFHPYELELALLRRRPVDRVAGHAGKVARFVGASRPEHLLAACMALEADGVLAFRRQARFLAEAEIVGGVRRIFQVFAPRAVAALAPPGLNLPFG